MKYQVIKNGQLVELPVRVKRQPGVEDIYAHGAAGAPVANYHFRIDFYRDAFPPAEMTLMGNQVSQDSITHIERQVVASIFVPFPFLKELRNWLSENIDNFEKEYGEIQLPKKEVDEGKLPKAKEA